MATTTDPIRARETLEFLIESLGTPTRRPISDVTSSSQFGADATWLEITPGDTGTFHPVFAFAHHFRANDSGNRGYTDNTMRGDHMSVPGYTEEGVLAVVEISFHKGGGALSVVTFDAKPTEFTAAAAWTSKYRAAIALLEEHETR